MRRLRVMGSSELDKNAAALEQERVVIQTGVEGTKSDLQVDVGSAESRYVKCLLGLLHIDLSKAFLRQERNDWCETVIACVAIELDFGCLWKFKVR